MQHERTRKRPLTSPAASTAAITAVMKPNKKKDSPPEIAVRRALCRLGYRYRLHAHDLPGNADIVFRRHTKVISNTRTGDLGCYGIRSATGKMKRR